MHTTPTADTPAAAATAPPSPSTVRPNAARPETVMVCELVGGDVLVRGTPDGPLAYLAGPDAEPLRIALDAAFQPPVTESGRERPRYWRRGGVARRTRLTGVGQVDAQAVAEMLAVAYHDLPIAQWLVPEPRERTEVLQRWLLIWVDHTPDHGHVDMISADTGKVIAAAVWLPHDPTRPGTVPYDYGSRVTLACRANADRFDHLGTVLEACHPHHRRHHHLAHVAVHLERRGRGSGTYLLAIAHEGLDTDRVPALHITATTPARDGQLERHGYLPRRNPHPLPDAGSALWPLWRHPASAPRA